MVGVVKALSATAMGPFWVPWTVDESHAQFQKSLKSEHGKWEYGSMVKEDANNGEANAGQYGWNMTNTGPDHFQPANSFSELAILCANCREGIKMAEVASIYGLRAL